MDTRDSRNPFHIRSIAGQINGIGTLFGDARCAKEEECACARAVAAAAAAKSEEDRGGEEPRPKSGIDNDDDDDDDRVILRSSAGVLSFSDGWKDYPRRAVRTKPKHCGMESIEEDNERQQLLHLHLVRPSVRPSPSLMLRCPLSSGR